MGSLGSNGPNTPIQVVHLWKKNGIGHHSHMAVLKWDAILFKGADGKLKYSHGDCYFDLGLFSEGQTNAPDNAAIYRQRNDLMEKGYSVSESYQPNPIVVTYGDFATAVDNATKSCGGVYHLFHNNCQKFARYVMENLGAEHHRKFFHF